MTFFLAILDGLIVLLLAPLTVGFVRLAKARFQNRRGAPVYLPYLTLLSLMRKEMTVTKHSSWVFAAAPFFVLASAIALAFIVPTAAAGVLPDFASNLFLVGGIAAFGSVFLAMGGMDAASTFGNMGASREMTLAAFVEPAFYMGFSALALVGGTWSLDGILRHLASLPWSAGVPAASIALVALVFVTLAENARYPVDNPATHLELTMVHEAMLLEYSGPSLALLEYASAVKLTVMLGLVASLSLPFFLIQPPVTALGLVLGVLALIAKLALAAFVLAFIESTFVKMRFYRMQEYFSLAFIVALAGLLLALISMTR
ncbi:MAG: NADH-quinone oxidoreductase subunit H [Patescibacteria group bacterium]|nr:NADH-quinone oxidoreductase subunit H [Patescibacteria group bacterium]MDE1966116.1 NADH-quinone oxidoreductase subunit H [Patescibacteria group bacterium]